MEETLILYPCPAMGHLVSMVEFGKLILELHPSFSITILVSTPPYSTGSIAEYIAAVSSATLSFTFRHIHPTSPLSSTQSFEEIAFELIRLCNPNLHEALHTLSKSAKIKAIILDFFNYAAMDVAEKLEIPTYYFFTSSATSLSGLLYFPTMHETTTGNLKDLNILLDIPGSPPLRAADLAATLLVPDTKIYKEFIDCSIHMSKSAGIIVNTFKLLEPKALKAISDGLCLPERPTPPIFTVGPLISTKDKGRSEHECLQWLSSQPSKSVVFLCFGSSWSFSTEQLTEMAVGLEKSGHRFLWVVRTPPQETNKTEALSIPISEPNLDELLPMGFLERTKQRGLVVKTWAPQVAILNHDSVGGFVTHCGWNSVLEAVCAGVPMVAWPLYAEQKMNRVWLVEEVKVALPMNESEDGFVGAAELEDRINELMNSESGERARYRILVLQDEAMSALQDGGSSLVDLTELAKLWGRSQVKKD